MNFLLKNWGVILKNWSVITFICVIIFGAAKSYSQIENIAIKVIDLSSEMNKLNDKVDALQILVAQQGANIQWLKDQTQ